MRSTVGIVLALALSASLSAQQPPPAPTAPARHLAVTDNDLRTAFTDPRARDLVTRARAARLGQDSSLRNYDAGVRERLTARLGIGAHGPQRVVYRQESAFRVQWQRGVGARVELTGARVGVPIAPPDAERDALEGSVTDPDMTPIPYVPGQEGLSFGSAMARADVDDRGVVNPLANGAEAYYTYILGDSMAWTLPDARRVRLRELEVRPRWPRWNLVVGSLWFDAESGQLVRAAYRLSTPTDIWARAGDRTRDSAAANSAIGRRILKAFVSPFRQDIDGIAIEYGLFEGRYWLPRSRSLSGMVQFSFARVPISIEQAFTYAAINGPDTLAAIAVNDVSLVRPETPDSLGPAAARAWRDSVYADRRRVHRAFTDSLHTTTCQPGGTHTVARERQGVVVAVEYPCDVQSLARSPDFTTSIYDANEAVFDAASRDALLADALPFGAQALFTLSNLPAPSVDYGLSMTRYNRVEGLSTGVRAEQQFGGGYVGTGSVRLGVADREPNVELSLARTNVARTVSLDAYNRLVSASDWGQPLSFGASVSALLFGRDDGFYSRASGAALRWNTTRGLPLDWTLFAERERSARAHTAYSVSGTFVPNIEAAAGSYAGGGVRWHAARGLDPRGVRLASDVRLEAAGGAASYGRAAGDVTLSSGLPHSLGAALTLAAGSSAGGLPPQRMWYLGGTETVRGQQPDTAQRGNAFWLTRLEFGPALPGYRVLLFGDLGWTGDRAAIRNLIRPMSGVGVGLSTFDGLVRLDVARGIYPRAQTRVTAYLSARY